MFEKIVTEYWSHITLLLLAIAYFIKRIFDVKSKKIEINHSLFQQNRLKTVNDFFTNYARAETMWNQIAIWEILSKKVDAKEIDRMIFPILNDLKKTLFELKIYFKKEDHKYFDDLVKGIYAINGKVSELYFDYDNKKKDVIKANEFSFFKVDIIEKNNKIIDNICLMISDTFKS